MNLQFSRQCRSLVVFLSDHLLNVPNDFTRHNRGQKRRLSVGSLSHKLSYPSPCCELLEARFCLSVLAFDSHLLTRYGNAAHPGVADVNGDGYRDLIVFSQAGIDWYENIRGQGNFGEARTVTHDFIDPSAFANVDIDGDGDIDIVVTSVEHDKIAWLENTDGLGMFSERRQIASRLSPVLRIHPNDVDGDHDVDLLLSSSYSESIVWLENVDGRGDFRRHALETELGRHLAHAVDLDADGDLDIVASATNPRRRIVWHPNIDGRGNFGTEQILAKRWFPRIRGTFDVDGDGDLDILASIYNNHNSLAWYENLGVEGQIGAAELIIRTSATSFLPIDFGGDGDLDILEYNLSRVWLHENIQGISRLEPPIQVIDEAHDVLVASDLNHDGRLDLVTADGGLVLMHQQSPAEMTFHDPVRVAEAMSGVSVIDTADLDGDNDEDLIVIVDAMYAWLENAGGRLMLDPPYPMHAWWGRRMLYRLQDLDGDGDTDLITSHANGVTSWHENLDGRGQFGPQQIIGTQPSQILSLTIADMDADETNDVIVTTRGNAYWYPNETSTFGPPRAMVNSDVSRLVATVGDVDGDGDNDFVAQGDKIEVYRYSQPEGGFVEAVVIDDNTSQSRSIVLLTDVDGDSDLDLVSGQNQKVVWYENTDGLGTFAPARLVGSLCCSSIDVIDMDNDGDLDIWRGGSWVANIDGQGHFSTRRRFPYGLPYDLDGDGDIDGIMSDRNGLWWNEARLLGDVNRDDKFDSTDLIQVFVAGWFEADPWNKVSFDEGDWNFDGRFDSSDLVAAFQSGNYKDAVNSKFDQGNWNQDPDFDSRDFVLALQAENYVAAAQPFASALAAAVDWLFAREDDTRRKWAFVT